MSDALLRFQERLYERSIGRKLALADSGKRIFRFRLLLANVLAALPTLANAALLGVVVYALLHSQVFWASLLLLLPLMVLTLMPIAEMLRRSKPAHSWRRKDHPEVFAAVDRLARVLGTRGLDRITISGDFNAWISTGWGGSTMNLGVPLAAVLTPEELHSVICHELGHLRRDQKSPLEHWLIAYCLGSIRYWLVMMDGALESREPGVVLLVPLFWLFRVVLYGYACAIHLLLWHETLISELKADKAALAASTREAMISVFGVLDESDVVESCLSESVIHREEFSELYLSGARQQIEEFIRVRARLGTPKERPVVDHPRHQHSIANLKEPGETRELDATHAILGLVQPRFREVLDQVKRDYDHTRGA